MARRLALVLVALLTSTVACHPVPPDFVYPDDPELPAKPWFPDGDVAFTSVPRTKHPRSDAILEHLERSGRLVIRTGDVVPKDDGRVGGTFMNLADASTPLRTISPFPLFGPDRVTVWDGATWRDADYGSQVRVPDDPIIQGYPMTGYSDRKVHVFDSVDRRVHEFQHFEHWPGGAIRVHGLKSYDLDRPSTEARGSSAAGVPRSYMTLTPDDVRRGWVQRTFMGVISTSATEYVPPARGTDGTDPHPDATPMGVILRLKPESRDRLVAAGAGPQAQAVMESYVGPGIMVADTAGTNSTGLQPSKEWDQEDVGILRTLTWEDFEVWVL